MIQIVLINLKVVPILRDFSSLDGFDFDFDTESKLWSLVYV